MTKTMLLIMCLLSRYTNSVIIFLRFLQFPHPFINCLAFPLFQKKKTTPRAENSKSKRYVKAANLISDYGQENNIWLKAANLISDYGPEKNYGQIIMIYVILQRSPRIFSQSYAFLSSKKIDRVAFVGLRSSSKLYTKFYMKFYTILYAKPIGIDKTLKSLKRVLGNLGFAYDGRKKLTGVSFCFPSGLLWVYLRSNNNKQLFSHRYMLSRVCFYRRKSRYIWLRFELYLLK